MESNKVLKHLPISNLHAFMLVEQSHVERLLDRLDVRFFPIDYKWTYCLNLGVIIVFFLSKERNEMENYILSKCKTARQDNKMAGIA